MEGSSYRRIFRDIVRGYSSTTYFDKTVYIKHLSPHDQVELEEIEEKYLKNRNPIRYIKTNRNPKIGIMNGLWANSLGLGGIITIETKWIPSNNFLDLKLTGMQGDVMKESMNVAKTLAWKLTKSPQQKKLCKEFNSLKNISILVSRIPRTRTDQTMSLLEAKSENPEDVMLPIIREMPHSV